jgi:hypothetical protein
MDYFQWRSLASEIFSEQWIWADELFEQKLTKRV